MFTGSGNSSAPHGSKNPYASSQASKSLNATFSSQGTPWQSRSTSNTIFGGASDGSAGITSGGFASMSTNRPSTGFGSGSTPTSENSGFAGWNARSPGGFNLSSKPSAVPTNPPNAHPAPTSFTFKCRMCQTAFTTSEDLKKHIKTEGHFDTSRAPVNTFGGNSFAGGSQPPRSFHSQPLVQGDNPTGGLFGLTASGNSSVTASSYAPPLPVAPQPNSAPFDQASGPSRGPRGPTLPSGTSFQSQQSHQQKPWDKPKASQDARQQQPRPSMLNPPRPGATFGQTSFTGAVGAPTHSQSNTFGSQSASSSGPLDVKAHPFVPRNAAPRPFSSNKFPSTGFGTLQSVPENSVQSAPKDLKVGTGFGGGNAIGAINSPGSADEDAEGEDDGEEEEEDDLNFSFSSQESGVGDVNNNTHSSPIKGPGLGSPAAAARARAEEGPQRALFTQSTPVAPASLSHSSSAPAFGGTSILSTSATGSVTLGNSSAMSGSQGGASSSLMGFMKASSKFPSASAQPSTQPSSQQSGASTMQSSYGRMSDDAAHGSDSESSNADGTDAMGTCEDMCPAEERTKRLNESDIHKLEIPHPDMTPGRTDYALTMVKKFQRSSADHALQIPHLLRTPEALLRSIEYIENELMDRASKAVFDPRIGEGPSTLFIYLFVWDRYRMVAKDFTLQQSMLPLTRIWVECHERMARWFILMDHKMQAADDFISAGHGQQNGESLNNLLKTLHGYYFRSRVGADLSAPSEPIDMPNKAEFVCYFVLFQLGNGGEVSKYLQQLPDEVLNSPQVRFAIEVWGALKTQNYAKYFRLLRTRATLLQACLMHRYMGEVRLTALKKLTRSLNPPGNKPQEYLLKDLMTLFMFESVSECVEFVEHCGLTCCPSSAADLDPAKAGTPTEDFVVLLSGQNIDHLLPRDKNDRPIPPATHYMGYAIDTVKCLRSNSGSADGKGECCSIAEVCRGFATGGSAPIVAPPAPTTTASARSASTAAVAAQNYALNKSSKTGEIGVRVPTAMSSTTSTMQNNNNTTTPAASLTTTTPAAVPVLTEEERSAAKARFLAGMGSGRGRKKESSPIVPVTDDDVWGPPDVAKYDKKSERGDKKSDAKRITPTFGAGGSGGSNISTAATDTSGAWGKQTTALSPSTGASGSNTTTKPNKFGFGFTAAPPAGTGVSQDSWRRAAPANIQKHVGHQPSSANASGSAFGSQTNNSSASSSGTGETGQPKVSAFGAFPSAVPSSVAATAAPVSTLGAFKVAPSTTTAAVTAGTQPVYASLNAYLIATNAAAAPPAPAASTEATAAQADAVPTSTSFAPKVAPGTNINTTSTTTPTTSSTAAFSTNVSGSVLDPRSAPFVPAIPQSAANSTNKHAIDSIIPKNTNPAPPAVPARPSVNEVKLEAFQRRMSNKQRHAAQASVLLNWRNMTRKAAEQRQAKLTALYFLLWRQGCKRSRRERDTFMSDIASIQMVDPLSQELGGMRIFGESNHTSTANVLKRKQMQLQENQRRLQSVAQREVQARYTLLCDAECNITTLSVVSDDSVAMSATSVRQQRHTKSLLDSVGRTLRAVKTLQLHSLLGLPVAPSAVQALHTPIDPTTTSSTYADTSSRTGIIEGGPQYTGALCFKLAVISDCTTAGVACKHGQGDVQCACHGFSNALRSQLANERGYGYHTTTTDPSISSNTNMNTMTMSKAQLGKMKKRRGQLARALVTKEAALSAVRVGLHAHSLDAHTMLQLSVVDVCGGNSSAKSVATSVATSGSTADPTAQVEAVTDLAGTQAAVVVINTDSVDRVTSALMKVLQCAVQNMPVVLVLFHATTTNTASNSTSTVNEVPRDELLYSTTPSLQCSVIRSVLSELRAALPPNQRDAFLSVIQGSIVVDTPVLQSDFATPVDMSNEMRVSMQRALQLLVIAAPPTPVVLRLRPEELLLHHLHGVRIAHRNQDLVPYGSENSQSEMNEQLVRSAGHVALERALNAANIHLSAVAELLNEQQATNVRYSHFPATDFVTLDKSTSQDVEKVAYLSGGIADLTSLQSANSTSSHAPASDLFLPHNWVESSQLTHIADALQTLRYPSWSADQSIAVYQELLVNNAQKGSVLHAGNFVASLEEVLNRAYATRQVAHLPAAIDHIVQAITEERVRNLCDNLHAKSVYIALDKHASLVEWVKFSNEPILNRIAENPQLQTVVSEGGSYEVYRSEEAIMMSPAGTTYIEQSQYAQAFPTGFGRSLFAQFSRDSILSTDTPKVKRSFDADGADSGDKRAKYNGTESHTTTPQRNNNNNSAQATPHSTGYGIAYDKLFGSAVKGSANTNGASAPSTPHAAVPTDPGTRALHSQVRSEQAATDRLNNMLETALSPLRSPIGTNARANTAVTPTGSSSNSKANSASKLALQDPMRFIEECRRERERFETAVML